ncbi:MAG: DUF2877 domain-containing protein [Vulcanimicrobiota bacterium]
MDILELDESILKKGLLENIKVHSIFKNTLVLKSGVNQGMVTLVNPGRGQGPDFIVAQTGQNYKSWGLKPNDRPVWQNKRLKFPLGQYLNFNNADVFNSYLSIAGNMINPQVCNRNLICVYRYFRSKSDSLNLFSLIFLNEQSIMFSDLIKKRLKVFVNSLESGVLNNALISLKSIIGLGWGLTPACDDFLVGFILVLHFLERLKPSDCLLHSFLVDFRNKTLEKATEFLGQTSFVSSNYLRFALEKRFTWNLKELAREVFWGDINKQSRILKNLSEFGSTSGFDLTAGFLLGCNLCGLVDLNNIN